MGIALIICMGITMVIAILWTRGIDNMKNEHPDYKGEDLFGYFDNINKTKKENE